MDAIVHVLRCFENDDIQHVANKVDPLADAEVVETELLLADLESLEKRVPNLVKKGQQGDKESKIAASVLTQALELLREGKPARLTVPKDEEEARVFVQAQLITAKPILYVCNVNEEDAANGNELSAKVFAKAKAEGANAVVVSAAIESELTGMDDADKLEFLGELGLTETGLARVIRAGYELLHLITFFTVGPKEARAWTVEKGAKGPQAAGRHPLRLRTRLHPRRNHRLRRLCRARRRSGRARRRQAAPGRQGICRRRRRRAALQVQRLSFQSAHPDHQGHAMVLPSASVEMRAFQVLE